MNFVIIHHSVTNVVICANCSLAPVLISKVQFGADAIAGMREAAPELELARYGEIVRAFLDGKQKDLSMLPLDLSGHSPFARMVLGVARKIPWGTTVSYGELARRSGFPDAARAVANVLRNNAFPLIVPCHRVIKSDLSIGGFMGKIAGNEVDLKIRLLHNEGLSYGG